MTSMSWFRGLGLISIALAGCDPAGDAAVAGSCRDLADQFQTLGSQIDRNCIADSDCMLIGDKLYEDTCDCELALPPFAVNAAAYQGSQAQQLADTYFAQCQGDPSAEFICDESPLSVYCSANDICQASGGDQCFLPDAAPAID